MLTVFTRFVFAEPPVPVSGRVSGREAITGPFKRVTTIDAWAVQSETGVTTEPVRRGAEAFLAALSEPQRAKTLFLIDDLEWQLWDNRHFAARQGVGFTEMDAKRGFAFGLLGAALSARGSK